jgi:hypothetical protein
LTASIVPDSHFSYGVDITLNILSSSWLIVGNNFPLCRVFHTTERHFTEINLDFFPKTYFGKTAERPLSCNRSHAGE